MIVVCLFAVLAVASMVGIVRMRDGLDITDIVPRGTNEHRFLEAQSQYFGFYNFYAVTQVPAGFILGLWKRGSATPRH